MNVTRTHVETGALAPTHSAAIDVPAALATLASTARWILMIAHLVGLLNIWENKEESDWN